MRSSASSCQSCYHSSCILFPVRSTKASKCRYNIYTAIAVNLFCQCFHIDILQEAARFDHFGLAELHYPLQPVPEHAFQNDLAQSHLNIGIELQDRMGKPSEAIAAFREALAIRQKLADDNPTDTKFQSGLAKIHNNIGNLLRDTGKPAEALKVVEPLVGKAGQSTFAVSLELDRADSSWQFGSPANRIHGFLAQRSIEFGR